MTTWSGQLPTGKRTRSMLRYTRAWRKLSRPLEKAFGVIQFGYDPNLTFFTSGEYAIGGATWTVPLECALRFYEHSTGKKFKA